MNYDFDYYSGSDIKYPNKPSKPKLERNPSSIEARVFAEALEEYEREIESYDEDLSYYKHMKTARLNEFKTVLRDDHDITEAQFNVIWHHAWEHGHSTGLHDVCSYFEDFYELASEFAALEKN
jgi:hypothetical protein